MTTLSTLFSADLHASDWTAEPWARGDVVKCRHADPVAAAHASWRLAQNGGTAWADLDDVTVLPEDEQAAQRIRAYYGPNISMRVLKNLPVSPFRVKLAKFLLGEIQLTEGEIGLAYRLPYFYYEDLEIDRVSQQWPGVTDHAEYANMLSRARNQNLGVELTLQPEAHVYSSRRGQSKNQWIFSTQIPRVAFVWATTANTELDQVIGSLHQMQQPIRVSTRVLWSSYPGRDQSHLAPKATRILRVN